MKSLISFFLLLASAIAIPLGDIDLSEVKWDYGEISLALKEQSINNRIAGGEVAKPHQFPYQVGLFLSGSWCGGALISDRFVLTAAHCLFLKEGGSLFLGLHNISKPDPGILAFKVQKRHFIIHDDYDPSVVLNDIGLIRLPTKIKFTVNIQPINLPSSNLTQEDIEGKLAIASGWGKIGDTGTISRVLRFVQRSILPHKSCRTYFPKSFRPSKEICVDGSNSQSVCSGDSGGPLVIEGSKGSKTLIGLTSFGKREGCTKGFPAVFTRVSKYINWISNQTGIVM